MSCREKRNEHTEHFAFRHSACLRINVSPQRRRRCRYSRGRHRRVSSGRLRHSGRSIRRNQKPDDFLEAHRPALRRHHMRDCVVACDVGDFACALAPAQRQSRARKCRRVCFAHSQFATDVSANRRSVLWCSAGLPAGCRVDLPVHAALYTNGKTASVDFSQPDVAE